MEHNLLAVGLANREDFFQIDAHIELRSYTREFQIVWAFMKDYYDRDYHTQYVDRGVFGEIVRLKVNNDKHTDKFMKFVDEAQALEVSGSNVKEVIFLAKQEELRLALALALTNNKEHTDLLAQYQAIKKMTDLDELLDRGIEVFTEADMERLLAEDKDPRNRIPIMPLALNKRLDNGMRGADHMTLYARPEMGKTAAIVTMAVGAAKAGFKVSIFNNEERIERLYVRALSCITGMTVLEVRADPKKARDLAERLGFGNLKFISLSPGTLKQIESFIDKDEPNLAILDQLRNVAIKSESRTNQLEAVATGFRDLLKKYGVAGVSVTQAGDSAEGKAVLEMGDVDYSNTGIPAACDVLLGIGGTPAMVQEDTRTMSLVKNKVGTVHEAFPVKLNRMISKYVSVGES